MRLRPRTRQEREAIQRIYRATGRVHIPAFFDPSSAQRIAHSLQHETDWQLSLNSGDRHVDLTAEQLALLPTAQQVLLGDAITEHARYNFQYVFNNFPIHDLYTQDRRMDHPLMRVYELLNSEEFLGFAREITGIEQIAFADAQATLYRPGHFLTAHDDTVPGKNRLAAYVLNFTPQWRVDWGGILQFIDDDGHVAEGFTPSFNALNLLRVPQKHCVSFVTPAAAAGRYSITGWLRGR